MILSAYTFNMENFFLDIRFIWINLHICDWYIGLKKINLN